MTIRNNLSKNLLFFSKYSIQPDTTYIMVKKSVGNIFFTVHLMHKEMCLIALPHLLNIIYSKASL